MSNVDVYDSVVFIGRLLEYIVRIVCRYQSSSQVENKNVENFRLIFQLRWPAISIDYAILSKQPLYVVCSDGNIFETERVVSGCGVGIHAIFDSIRRILGNA